MEKNKEAPALMPADEEGWPIPAKNRVTPRPDKIIPITKVTLNIVCVADVSSIYHKSYARQSGISPKVDYLMTGNPANTE